MDWLEKKNLLSEKAPSLGKMKAAAVGLSGQDSRDQLKLPCVVWTNLVFQVPQSKIPSKVTTRKTRNQERSLIAASKQGFRNEDGITRKKNGESKLPPLWTGCSQEDPPLLSSPKTWVPSEKQPTRKILVDLRPLLENVMDPVDSWEKKPLEKQPLQERCPSTSGDPRGEGLLEGGGEDRATETPADFSEDRGIPRVHLFLPPIGASKLRRKKIKISKRTIWVLPEESTQLRKIPLPAIQTFQPQLHKPLLFSKGNLQKDAPLQEKRPAEPGGGPEEASWGLPTASSPDFQLPTQLLLQKLQETTTSSNHLLIAKVLRSLREELLRGNAYKSDHRENQNDFLELPRIQPWTYGKADVGQKAFEVTDMETAKNRLIRLIGNYSSVLQGTGVLQVPPGP
ncbi:uncharacterized protein LOC120303462 [Crotalus tigris]|uniref:uncharacterized protein LOC120303462 n=1 Tax=Crotalus tigris TaxID=88082 RepID=UPI00192F6A46|nr:uncharacterized protein LOC120303462 [Crotalus tigris]